MALLLHLVENAGHTVSREQLFEALWPGVVVSDDTLTQAVIKLRKALGDSARNPRYIETIPKRGYRLCAKIDAVPGLAGGVPARSVTSSRTTGYLALLLLLLALGTLAIYATRDGTRGDTRSTPVAGAVQGDGPPSLTVQPFAMLGDDASQAYLAQGLTLDLITDLSKLSGLLVIGSRSIMGQTPEAPEALAVRYRVAGEVQRVGDQIRIHVHLLDAASGRQIWSERYDRAFENLFELQEEISHKIVSTLSLRVNAEEKRRLARRYTHSVQAYELFLRAQALLLVRQQAENEQARRYLREAIAIDPSFARAYGGLALSFAADFRNQWTVQRRDALDKARAMARTALEIDPEIPEVYWVLAYVSAQQRQHEKALGLLRKAVSLDRSFADAYALMGGIMTYIGQPRETPGLLRTAIRLNPDAGYLYYLLLGRAYCLLGDWEQALINLNEALERNPSNLEAHIYLAVTLESHGDHEGAIWEKQEILAIQPDFDAVAWFDTYPMTGQDQIRQMLSALAHLDLEHG